MYYTILYYSILYYSIRYYTVLFYPIQCYTTLYYTILYYTTLYYTTLYETILNHTILFYTIYVILYYDILYLSMLHYTIPYHAIPYYTMAIMITMLEYICTHFASLDYRKSSACVLLIIRVRILALNAAHNRQRSVRAPGRPRPAGGGPLRGPGRGPAPPRARQVLGGGCSYALAAMLTR